MLPTLLGITFLTFFVLDLAPLDRASLELATRELPSQVDADQREVALARLRIRYGLVDEETLEPVPVYERYGRWLWNALSFNLAGGDEDQAVFRERLFRAFPVSILLGFWALLLALVIGAPFGAWLGMRAGSRIDQTASNVMFLIVGLPEVLVATLLLLTFGAAGLDWFPTDGLVSEFGGSGSVLGRMWDLASHLVLPVTVMAIGPLVLITRFLRESVSRAAASTFARNLQAWGIDPGIRRSRLLRAGFAPIATLAGTLLPMLVTGSIIVETVFSIEGAGRLAWDAVRTQDQAMVMAITLLVSIVTLISLTVSDLAHHWIDPRVRLQE